MGTSGERAAVSLGAPSGASVKASSGNVANAAAVAALAAAAGVTNFVDGFAITAAGATAAAVVTATLTDGTTTFSFTFVFPGGATTQATPLIVNFAEPIPASGPNTAWTLTLPAGGLGNTNAAVSIWGRRF